MEPFVFQFVLIVPCPVPGHHWRESGPILTVTLKIFVYIGKIPVQLSLLQAKLIQFLQAFLIREMMLQTPTHLYSPRLDQLSSSSLL